MQAASEHPMQATLEMTAEEKEGAGAAIAEGGAPFPAFLAGETPAEGALQWERPPDLHTIAAPKAKMQAAPCPLQQVAAEETPVREAMVQVEGPPVLQTTATPRAKMQAAPCPLQQLASEEAPAREAMVQSEVPPVSETIAAPRAKMQ